MTDDERALMVAHAAYLSRHFDEGTILAYGPVFDPAGAFGIAIFDVGAREDAERIAQGDPTILAGLNTYSLAPMNVVRSQGTRTPAT